MAKFRKEPSNRRCDLCGRLGTDNVRVNYARDSASPRSVATRQLFICSPCGKIIFQLGKGEGKGKDRTRRYEKDLP
jgi:hypothetical protein